MARVDDLRAAFGARVPMDGSTRTGFPCAMIGPPITAADGVAMAPEARNGAIASAQQEPAALPA